MNSAGLTLDVSAPPTNLLPAHICSARIVKDPLNVFSILDIADDYLNVQATSNAAYYAHPYDCIVRLITNRGVRNINLGIAQEATDHDRDELEKEADNWRKFCQAITLTTLPFDEPFQVPTSPAPPVEIFGVDHWILFRDLSISGLESGSSIALRDNDSHALTLATAASDAGVAHPRSFTEVRTPRVQTCSCRGRWTTNRQVLRTGRGNEIARENQIWKPPSGQPRGHGPSAQSANNPTSTPATSFGENTVVEFVPELEALRVYEAIKVGVPEAGHLDVSNRSTNGPLGLDGPGAIGVNRLGEEVQSMRGGRG